MEECLGAFSEDVLEFSGGLGFSTKVFHEFSMGFLRMSHAEGLLVFASSHYCEFFFFKHF